MGNSIAYDMQMLFCLKGLVCLIFNNDRQLKVIKS
jgi:hypothetical protein